MSQQQLGASIPGWGVDEADAASSNGRCTAIVHPAESLAPGRPIRLVDLNGGV